ncbi:MAG: cellulase family glycosylhydrolase, partial [Prevotellaceae bacterium]|nr:cellulase family glycosylhydrolase [Prevotellaceae bacterium]
KGSAGKLLYVDNIYAYQGRGEAVVSSVNISGATWIQHNPAVPSQTSPYSATVSGSSGPPQAVTWTLGGDSSPATAISDAGLLTIATDELSTKLRVTATSVYDPTKSASLTVTLINPPVRSVDTSVNLTSTLPHCPAPAPRHDPDDVMAIFSDAYPYDPSKFSLTYDDWLAAGKKACTEVIISPFDDSTETLLMLDTLYNDNQSQISLGTFNLSKMDSIHIDIYSPGDNQGIGEFDFGLIFNWSGGNHVAANIWLNITNADLHGRWISFDLPLSRFAAFNPNITFNNINILRLRRGGGGSKGIKLYVDNIYAYGTGNGQGSGPIINPPDENHDTVTPTAVPPAFTLAPENVKSIFCEQYEAADYQENLGIWDVSGSYTLEDDYVTAKMNYGQHANQDREFVEIVPGNRQIHLSNWNDYPFKVHRNSTTMDLSDMDYLHFSVFQSGELDYTNKAVSVTAWMHDNSGGNAITEVAFVTVNHGEWTSVSIPLCYYRDRLKLDSVYVLRLRLGGYNSQAVYVDNIFAYRGEPFTGTQVAADCLSTIPGEKIEDKTDGILPPVDRAYLGVNLASASGGTNPGRYGYEYKMPSFEDLYYFKKKGVRLIRLPFRWQRVQSELGGELTVNDMTEMKKVVKEAERLGIWVLLDMHDYCERSIEGKLYEIGVAGHREWTGSAWGAWREDAEVVVTAQHYADAWKRIALYFADCRNIWGYDLMNEPKGLDISILKSNYQTVIDTLRKYDTKTAIVVEGKDYADAPGWEGKSGILKDLTDPIGNNIIYECHTYFDKDNSGTYRFTYEQEVGQNFNIYKSRLAPFIKWCKDNGKKGMLGEFGVPYNGASNSDARYMMLIDSVFSYLKQNQLTATYWCGGAMYDSYQLTVQPEKDYATEKSTMLIMQKYITGFANGSANPGEGSGSNNGSGDNNGEGEGNNNGSSDNSTAVTLVSSATPMSVYPNPVLSDLRIEAKRAIRQVRVLNLAGQTVKIVEPRGLQCSVDFSPLAKGAYIVTVTLDDNTSFAQKVIK